MDAVDLETRTRSGWIPPRLVALMVERGHLDEVAAQARGGDWFCARAWAGALAGAGRLEEALTALAPFTATGRWKAVETEAGLLERWGRPQEAVLLVRPHAERGHPPAVAHLARLLAGQGRGGEAFDLLRPYVEDWSLAEALVEVTAGLGRDEEVAALLADRIEAAERCDGPCGCRSVTPDNAVELLAEVRERQGRIDEAIALLRTRATTSIDGRDQLAELLARSGRIGELRAYAATDSHGHAARCLGDLLEERGDPDGAAAVYRRHAEEHGPGGNSLDLLAQLLVRHGRVDEAIEEVRSRVDRPGGGTDERAVDTLFRLYADHGRAEEGLTHLDALEPRLGSEDVEPLRLRLGLLVAAGHVDRAVGAARAHPASGSGYGASHVAGLLAGAGRPEAAVAYLEQCRSVIPADLARHLVEVGRIGDALAALRRPVPRMVPPSASDGPPTDRPPF
ncbi:tetratricopeptide repeat protein [Streptomyces sp. NRRL B-24484]|uniref:tetratricopeptide repeat protein n=1 Tax=Streptomyces sp. NRRL B-24484 TaxID=1463833 RepID=UPI0005BE7590|nr:tetratricopeptide repeat protein [Streptomyces sp. NRRL B-24484]